MEDFAGAINEEVNLAPKVPEVTIPRMKFVTPGQETIELQNQETAGQVSQGNQILKKGNYPIKDEILKGYEQQRFKNPNELNDYETNNQQKYSDEQTYKTYKSPQDLLMEEEQAGYVRDRGMLINGRDQINEQSTSAKSAELETRSSQLSEEHIPALFEVELAESIKSREVPKASSIERIKTSITKQIQSIKNSGRNVLVRLNQLKTAIFSKIASLQERLYDLPGQIAGKFRIEFNKITEFINRNTQSEKPVEDIQQLDDVDYFQKQQLDLDNKEDFDQGVKTLNTIKEKKLNNQIRNIAEEQEFAQGQKPEVYRGGDQFDNYRQLKQLQQNNINGVESQNGNLRIKQFKLD